MANVRQGYLDDYSQNNDKVGIGTSTSQEKLQIVGGLASKDLNITGIATITSTSGFIERNLEYAENVDLDAGDSATLSGEIIVGAGLTMTVGTAATASQGHIDSLKVYTMFQPPSGTTNQRPVAKPGSLFYNFDFKTVEFFDGSNWRQVDNVIRRGRTLMFGGFDVPTHYKEIDFVNISSQGNSQHFGDLSASTRMGNSFANETRGIHGCLYPSNTANIDYVSIASGGNAIDWGADRTTSAQQQGALATSTRGLFFGGASTNVIDYIEIQTTGNAQDFGDLTTARRNTHGFASPTRGVMSAGGEFPHSNHQTTDFVTVASKGNATLIGDIIGQISGVRCFSSSVVGFFAGGYNPGASVSRIKKLTTATLGNAFDFGDLTTARRTGATGNNGTRAVYMSGTTAFPAGQVNTIDAISISTSGNVTDFGDTSRTVGQTSGCSDSHGGLGGF